MKCPHCGAELQENACFCLYCMEQLDRKEQRKPIKKRKIRWLLWLAIAALFIAVILLLSFCKNEKQTEGNGAPATTLQRASGIEEQTNDNTSRQTEPPESESVGEEGRSERPTEKVSQEPTTTQSTTLPPSAQSPTEPSSAQTESECAHIYTEATCIAPMCCIYCGETYGVADKQGHQWQDVTVTIRHEEVGHYEEVCVDYEKVIIYGCVYCSAEVESFDALVRHFENAHSNMDNYEWHLEHLDNMCKVIEKWMPIYETQWIIDEPAYDETVVKGQKCALCGIENR